jgi:hypothetical protein
VLAPGKLIQGHAKLDEECKQCHVKFDRTGQDRLCMDCHKPVGLDMREKTGFHGRQKPQFCRSCHTDHKGRDIRIAEFDKKQFDHDQTDYVLHGKHAKIDCEKCHESGKKYREAATDCNTCHKKDDKHKGSLGPKCADCHNESSWKEVKFDHDKTDFALTGKHIDVKCADCHKDTKYKETPKTCIGCHKKDDDGVKGHKGLYGEKCETCHNAKAWKPSKFNHDTDTKYALNGKHKSVKCADCHTGNLYKVKTSQVCYDCHKKDDKHKDSLGKECAACHTERDWKETNRFDHDKTKFPLLGKHIKTECKECHKSVMFKEAPSDCYSCHKKDDKHETNLGEKCADCHSEKEWKDTKGRFDHDKTKFQLRNAHADSKVKCNACHKDLRSYRKTPLDCLSCHKKDDKHEGQEGKDCERCHGDKSWKVTNFDHGRTKFPLTGRHITAACKDCHETARYKDAKRECYSCHKKEDKHKQKLGTRCDLCHNARTWSVWDYDHDKRTKYKLEGKHRKVACELCHTREAHAGKDIALVATNCVSCHRGDDIHDGSFGVRCEQCHVAASWKQVSNRMTFKDDKSGGYAGFVQVLGRASYIYSESTSRVRQGSSL